MLKSNKQKITVYEPLAGKNKYVKSTGEYPNLSGNNSMNHYETTVVMADTAKLQFLKGNPFLFNPKTSPYPITSLEDYIIKVRREEMAFGEVIRNPRFSPWRRRRIVKKAFKKWNKEYLQTKNTAFTETDKLIDVIGEVQYLHYSLKMKLLSFALFALMLFIIGTDSILWQGISSGNFGYYLNQTFIQMFAASYWLKIVANITVYLIIILIFYSSMYSYISKDFKKHYDLSQAYLKGSEKTISKDYKKKFRKARKYYLSMINRKKQPYFPPLDITHIEEGEVNITTFNAISKVTVDRAYRFKKLKPYIIFGKNALVYLSIGGSLVVLAFSIYHIIKNIF